MLFYDPADYLTEANRFNYRVVNKFCNYNPDRVGRKGSCKDLEPYPITNPLDVSGQSFLQKRTIDLALDCGRYNFGWILEKTISPPTITPTPPIGTPGPPTRTVTPTSSPKITPTSVNCPFSARARVLVEKPGKVLKETDLAKQGTHYFDPQDSHWGVIDSTSCIQKVNCSVSHFKEQADSLWRPNYEALKQNLGKEYWRDLVFDDTKYEVVGAWCYNHSTTDPKEGCIQNPADYPGNPRVSWGPISGRRWNEAYRWDKNDSRYDPGYTSKGIGSLQIQCGYDLDYGWIVRPRVRACDANILYVLDKSSTMYDSSGLKSRAVRNAMLVKDKSQIGIKYKLMAFDGKVENNFTSNWVGFPELDNALVNMNLNGFGTAISSALSAASSEVKKDEGKKPTAVIFISDGVPSVSKDSCWFRNTNIMGSSQRGLGDNPSGSGSTTKSEGYCDRSKPANTNPITRCNGYNGSQSTQCNYCVNSKPTYGSALEEVLDQTKLFVNRSKVYLYTIGVLEEPYNDLLMKKIGLNGYYAYGKGTPGNLTVSQALDSTFEAAFEKMCGYKSQSGAMSAADWGQVDRLKKYCDIDNSGQCDSEDYKIALDNFNQSSKSTSRTQAKQVVGDLNGDRIFNAADISRWQEIINSTNLPL